LFDDLANATAYGRHQPHSRVQRFDALEGLSSSAGTDIAMVDEFLLMDSTSVCSDRLLK
jgi:hypothetical protein